MHGVSERTLPVDLVQATVAFALHQGWDVNDLLAKAGFSPLLLAEGKARVTERQLVTLTRELWAQTDDELLGLGRHPLPRGSMRVLLYGVLGAADLGESLTRTQSFLAAFPALSLEVETQGEETRLKIRLGGESDPDDLLSLTGLMACHRVLAWGIKHRVPLIRVELPATRPAQHRTIADLFDAPVVIDSPHAALVFNSALLRSPLMRDADELERFIARAPLDLLTRPTYSATTVDRVRRVLEPALARTGVWPSAIDVARSLGVSSQTLRRWLADERTTYSEVSDDVRRDAAINSLVGGRESVAELAERLGFSGPSAFTRAFRRWTGSTPGAYRNPDMTPQDGTDSPEA